MDECSATVSYSHTNPRELVIPCIEINKVYEFNRGSSMCTQS